MKKSPNNKHGLNKKSVDKISNDAGFPLWIGIILVFSLGLIIYSNSFDCSFHFDDKNNIIENTSLRDLTNPGKIWNESKLGKTRFIPYLSFALNYKFGNLDVWGYHLVNLLIHLLNAYLVYWLTILVFTSPNLREHHLARHKYFIAPVVALLFVSHPLATQSVTYIVQRMASMAAMFYFLSVALYIKARFSESKSFQKQILFAGAFASALLAMFSKENAFTLPITILLTELILFRKVALPFRLTDYRHLALLATAAGFFVFAMIRLASALFDPLLPTGGNHFTVTPLSYLLTQFPVIVKYIRLLFLPVNQNLDHDIQMSETLLDFTTLSSLLMLVSIVVLAIRLYRNHKIFTFGIFWFFIALSIESGVIPIEDLMFEHRTYLPSFGFFLTVTSGIFYFLWDKYKGMAIALLMLMIVSNSILTFKRNNVWKNELTLWNDAVSKSPEKARPYLNRGVANWDRGNRKQALEDYQKAVQLSPGNYSSAHFNLAVAFESFGQWDLAIENYNKTISLSPQNAEARSGLGVCYSNKGMADKAIAEFTSAIKLFPGNSRYYYNRGNTYMNNKQWIEAEADFSTAIRLDPQYIDAIINRATLYGMNGQAEKAIADCSRAIELDPGATKAIFNRAVTYFNAGMWNEAILDYSTYMQLMPERIDIFYNRGVAYLNTGQMEMAINDFNKVLSMDPNNQQALNNRAIAAARLSK